MARALPYFKFTPGEWMTGDIVYESFETQGLFINICALYWQREGVLSIEEINKRYKRPALLQKMLGKFFVVAEDMVRISFLDAQFDLRKVKGDISRKNGLEGGRPKGAKLGNKERIENPSGYNYELIKPNIEKEEEQEKEEDKERVFSKKGIAEFLLFENAKVADPEFYKFVSVYKDTLLKCFPNDFMQIQTIALADFSAVAREMIERHTLLEVQKVLKNVSESDFWKPQLYNLAAINKNFMAIKNLQVVKTGKNEEKPVYTAPKKVDLKTID